MCDNYFNVNVNDNKYNTPPNSPQKKKNIISPATSTESNESNDSSDSSDSIHFNGTNKNILEFPNLFGLSFGNKSIFSNDLFSDDILSFENIDKKYGPPKIQYGHKSVSLFENIIEPPPGLNHEYSPPGLNHEYSPPRLKREYSPPGLKREYSPPGLNHEYSSEGFKRISKTEFQEDIFVKNLEFRKKSHISFSTLRYNTTIADTDDNDKMLNHFNQILNRNNTAKATKLEQYFQSNKLPWNGVYKQEENCTIHIFRKVNTDYCELITLVITNGMKYTTIFDLLYEYGFVKSITPFYKKKKKNPLIKSTTLSMKGMELISITSLKIQFS